MNVQSPARVVPDRSEQSDRVRVMVVDDTLLVRSLLSRWIESADGLQLVGAHGNGSEALDHFDRESPDVVVLDVDMPVLDGIATLPKLLERRHDLAVIMASALTRDHAEITLKALALGALDYIPKPEARGGVMTSISFRRELIEKILALGRRRKSTAPKTESAAENKIERRPFERPPFALRPMGGVPPRVLLIGASTGGPAALGKLLPALDSITESAPILITQHMPVAFIAAFAQQLSRATARPVRIAADGEPVLAGSIYLAPGDRHMKVARRDGAAVVELDDGPPLNFCKPAVDSLFASAAEVWGAWNLALVLTGMGRDGASGVKAIAKAGGTVFTQDEATSVVWGMPGAAAATGVCAAVLPLDRIADGIVHIFHGGKL